MTARAKRSGGFTLLEVLVATVIMGVAVAGLLSGLSQSVKNVARLGDYDRAAMLARTTMNELLLDRTLPFNGNVAGTFSEAQTGGNASGWRAVVRPFEMPPHAGPGATVVQQIVLEVWWEPPTGTRRRIQLAGYRSAKIPFQPNP